MTRIIARSTAAALVAAYLSALPVNAAACVPLRDAAAALRARVPDAQVLLRLEGDRAATFLRAFNAWPPPTDLHGDQVVAFGAPSHRLVAVVILARDCVRAVAPVEVSAYREMLHAVDPAPPGAGA